MNEDDSSEESTISVDEEKDIDTEKEKVDEIILLEEGKVEDKVDEEEVLKDYKTNKFDTLVLPGGSIKGILILGGLQYCYDNFLLTDIKNYVGTSAGAFISFFLAIGYTPVEIITSICTNQVIEKMQHLNIFAMINNQGASSYTNLSNHLERMTLDKIGYFPTFHDIKHKFNKNLVFVTYNLTKDQGEYLSYETHPTLPCLVALRMSSNLPLVFESYKYDNNFYIDGGITDNFAIEHAEKIGNRVLGLYILYKNMSFSVSDNVLEYIFKVIYIPILEQQRNKIDKSCTKKSTVVNITDNTEHTMFSFNINSTDKLEMFSDGYNQCKNKL